MKDRLADRQTWQRIAQTWVRKTVARLRADAEHANESVRAVAGYDAAMLMVRLLEACDSLVAVLNVEDLDEVLRDARALADRLRDLRLAGKLEDVTGRTPEEAAAFLERAAALRGRS